MSVEGQAQVWPDIIAGIATQQFNEPQTGRVTVAAQEAYRFSLAGAQRWAVYLPVMGLGTDWQGDVLTIQTHLIGRPTTWPGGGVATNARRY